MQLPEDPVMLLSYVNTQLRDNYASLDDFCKALGVEQSALEEKLRTIDYSYDAAANSFV